MNATSDCLFGGVVSGVKQILSCLSGHALFWTLKLARSHSAAAAYP